LIGIGKWERARIAIHSGKKKIRNIRYEKEGSCFVAERCLFIPKRRGQPGGEERSANSPGEGRKDEIASAAMLKEKKKGWFEVEMSGRKGNNMDGQCTGRQKGPDGKVVKKSPRV